MEQEQPTKSWTTSAYDRVDREWVHTMNHSYDHTKEFDPEMLVRQAPAMTVRPTRRQQPSGDYLERVVTVGDIHFPFHNDQRLAAAEVGMRAIGPSRIDLLGDNLDNANYSRFESRRAWADSTQRGIDEYAIFLGRLRADHPHADIVWHEGNHDQRLEKRVREYNEDLLGIKPAGERLEALSLEFLLHLGELGIRMSKGYPSAREIIHGRLETYHGHITNGRGLAAGKVIEQAFLSFNTGHTHQAGIVSKTFWMGDEERTIYGAESGTFADLNQTPSGKYAPGQTARHNWQSVLVDWVITEEGEFPAAHWINDSGIQIGDKRYRV